MVERGSIQCFTTVGCISRLTGYRYTPIRGPSEYAAASCRLKLGAVKLFPRTQSEAIYSARLRDVLDISLTAINPETIANKTLHQRESPPNQRVINTNTGIPVSLLVAHLPIATSTDCPLSPIQI